jgi:hypothetical protein
MSGDEPNSPQPLRGSRGAAQAQEASGTVNPPAKCVPVLALVAFDAVASGDRSGAGRGGVGGGGSGSAFGISVRHAWIGVPTQLLFFRRRCHTEIGGCGGGGGRCTGRRASR